MGGTVPAVGPGGDPILVPEEEVGNLQASGGHVISQSESDAARARIAREQADADPRNIPGTLAETYGAGLHADVRGVAGSVGIPLDAAITGVAGVFGKGDAARHYLKGLDERHPYASGWMDFMGTARGAVGAAEVTGAAGLSAPGRIAAAGVENVIQGTTKDINEAALGDKEINAQKLWAAIPERFGMGAVFGTGGELAAAGLSKAFGAISRKGVTALEERAAGALGREVGLEGEEAIKAGRRIQDLHGGEMPTSRSGLADTLTKAQAAEREGLASSLAATHETEQATLAARQGFARSELEGATGGAIARAEREATEGTLDSMAKGGARVEEAELGGAARMAEARAAETAAGENLVRQTERETSAEVSAHVAQHQATREFRQVADHYESLMGTLKSEQREALEHVGAIEREQAANAKELADLLKKTEGAHEAASVTSGGRLTKAEFEEILDTYAGITGRGPVNRAMVRDQLLEMYGPPLETAAEAAGHGDRVARLQDLAKDLEKAHAEATSHLKMVEGATRTTEMQARQDIAAAGRRADAAIAEARVKTAPEFKRAEQAAFKATENLRKVESEVKATVEKARTKGQAEAAAAEKVGAAKVEKARMASEKARADFDALATKERNKLVETQTKAMGKTSSAPTSVDSWLTSLHAQPAPSTPLSGGAMFGAGLALAHGHPLGAAASLLTSFAASRARNVNNILAARTMRQIAKSINFVDDAIRSGAALALGRGAAADAGDAAERLKADKPKKLPDFHEVANTLVAMQANPKLLEDRVAVSLGPVAKDVPGLYGQSLVTAQKTQTFLLGILPPPQKDPNSLTPHLITGEVSDTQKYEFMRAYEVLVDPLSLFRRVNDGTVTETQVSAVKDVHTALFQKMVTEVFRQTAGLTSPMDYDREVNVGTLLGVKTTEVLEPDFQRAMRAAFDDKKTAGQPVGSGPKSGTKLDRNALSTAQRLESGESR